MPAVQPWLEYKGPVYIPTDHGDAQDVWMSDPMTLFGTMGLYARYTGNSQFEAAARWIQTHIAPGGAQKLTYRAGDFNMFKQAFHAGSHRISSKHGERSSV